MSFWDLSDGESAATGEKEFEQPSGNFDPIPNDSNVLAHIDEAKWDSTQNNDQYVSVRWVIDGPDEYLNRKIFTKLWVTDDDPNAKDADKAKAKRDKAKKMLAAIDANCGGKLARNARRPSDDDLALALQDKQMIIKCMVWEMVGRDGQTNSGNWISAVFPKSKGVSVKDAPVKAKAAPAKSFAADLDDDVPF